MEKVILLLALLAIPASASEPTCKDLELKVYDKCIGETGIDLGECAYMVFDEVTKDVSEMKNWQLQACTESVRRKIEVNNLRCD